MTQVVDGDLIKVMSWYDNEWGYSSQLVREALRIGRAMDRRARSEGAMIDVRRRLQLRSGASSTYLLASRSCRMCSSSYSRTRKRQRIRLGDTK